ncbi:MAG TPA: biotin carboxylase N-terminal domain-containing protein [Actinotalea sp.]
MHPPTAGPGLFATVLVANRGEIACRVIATLRDLGIRSVAVYSDADRLARHVRLADVAVRLGPAEPRASYLDVDAVVVAARAAGADAVHPGYGFLSENADLARACAEAGIVFIGPGIQALEIMGDKIRAKNHVSAAGVPVIPGVAGPHLSDDELVGAAAGLGYPLLVKPSAGGGGKGMVVVDRPEQLPDALAAARRVASAAFGDDTLLLERYLPAPRHIEVQLLADGHGSVIHLGERECSLQRRHQKVVEECPSPLLDPATRDRIGEAACAVARSVGYVGAGTVEFLVSADSPTEFFFMEMNTRLQVEHPVTELVTGVDLVEWQIRIAGGEPLTLAQADVRLTGHAVEARVYAEDPSRDFLPATGTVLLLDEPAGDGIRVDTSLHPGLEIGSTYDPLLSKVIAWAPDRAQALRRLEAALARTVVLGVRTNLEYLVGLLGEPDVRTGRLETGLLERLPAWTPRSPDPVALAAAALWRHESATARAADDGEGPSEGHGPGSRDPWRADGWRAGDPQPVRYEIVTADGSTVEVGVASSPDGYELTVGTGAPVPARLVRDGDRAQLELAGTVHHVRVVADGPVTWVGSDGAAFELRFRGRAERLADQLALITRGERRADPEVRSPMPGTVVSVDVADGDAVVEGQTLLTVEAMKMEHRLAAPSDGIVTLTVRPADRVALDHVVATITPHPHEGTPE